MSLQGKNEAERKARHSSISRKQRVSVGNKDTGGLRGGVLERRAPGQDSLLPSDFQCFHLEVQEGAVGSGRVNSLQPIFPCRGQRQLCNFPPSRSQAEREQEEEGRKGGRRGRERIWMP